MGTKQVRRLKSSSMPGIFLENARNSGKRDREHVIAEELQTKTQFLHELQRVFDDTWRMRPDCKQDKFLRKIDSSGERRQASRNKNKIDISAR